MLRRTWKAILPVKHLNPTRQSLIRVLTATIIPSVNSTNRSIHSTHHSTSSRNDTTSLLVDVEHVRQWSERNSNFARNIMQVPPPTSFSSSFSTSILSSSNFNSEDGDCDCVLVEYLKWRKWKYLSTEDDDDNNDKNVDDSTTANTTTNDMKMPLALLSHALTFPLTLGYNANLFLPTSKIKSSSSSFDSNHNVKNNIKHKKMKVYKQQIRLCCIGPRAETNLPLDMWNEFLLMANVQTNTPSSPTNIDENDGNDDDVVGDEYPNCVEVEWIIDFVGPDVPRTKMESRHTSLLHDNKHDENSDDIIMSVTYKSLTMNYHSALFHQHLIKMYERLKQKDCENSTDSTNSNVQSSSELTQRILNHWDGFVLFNPGIGHDNLRKGWMPTLNFLKKAKKPILTTAHSILDGQRDMNVWKDLLGYEEDAKGKTLEYNKNPFASRMAYKDPFPPSNLKAGEIHHVNPNNSILRILNHNNQS